MDEKNYITFHDLKKQDTLEVTKDNPLYSYLGPASSGGGMSEERLNLKVEIG